MVKRKRRLDMSIMALGRSSEQAGFWDFYLHFLTPICTIDDRSREYIYKMHQRPDQDWDTGKGHRKGTKYFMTAHSGEQRECALGYGQHKKLGTGSIPLLWIFAWHLYYEPGI
jgi:hypothetical protein